MAFSKHTSNDSTIPNADPTSSVSDSATSSFVNSANTRIVGVTGLLVTVILYATLVHLAQSRRRVRGGSCQGTSTRRIIGRAVVEAPSSIHYATVPIESSSQRKLLKRPQTFVVEEREVSAEKSLMVKSISSLSFSSSELFTEDSNALAVPRTVSPMDSSDFCDNGDAYMECGVDHIASSVNDENETDNQSMKAYCCVGGESNESIDDDAKVMASAGDMNVELSESSRMPCSNDNNAQVEQFNSREEEDYFETNSVDDEEEHDEDKDASCNDTSRGAVDDEDDEEEECDGMPGIRNEYGSEIKSRDDDNVDVLTNRDCEDDSITDQIENEERHFLDIGKSDFVEDDSDTDQESIQSDCSVEI